MARTNEGADTPAPPRLGETDYATVACPTCGVHLDPLPKAKKKCSHCGQAIWVRAGPDGRRYLLANSQLAAHEDWWGEHRRAQVWLDRTRGLLDARGLRELEQELAAKGPSYGPRDLYWAAANRRLLLLLKAGDWQEVQLHYFQMALIAQDEAEDGGSGPKGEMSERAHLLLREANLAQLRAYASEGCRVVSILRGEDCPTCRRESVRRVAIAAEFAAPRIPHRTCSEGWCACSYLPG